MLNADFGLRIYLKIPPCLTFSKEGEKGRLFTDAELFEDAIQYLFSGRLSDYLSEGLQC